MLLVCALFFFFQEGSRNYSITHNATIISNGFMHYGTTSDQFLRENLEWLKKASNWSKFSATASMGLIHYVRGDGAWRIVGGVRTSLPIVRHNTCVLACVKQMLLFSLYLTDILEVENTSAS